MKGRNMKALLALFLMTGLAYADTDPVRQSPTYAASGAAFTPATPLTDVCNIAGSATRTVRVTRVELSSTQSTAGINNFHLVKRSTANVGGTPILLSKVPFDSGSQSASASTVRYATAPTIGTSTGNIKTMHLLAPAPASVTSPSYGIWDYVADGGGVPITLRGIAESIGVNFNGLALPTGLSINCTFTWTEDQN